MVRSDLRPLSGIVCGCTDPAHKFMCHGLVGMDFAGQQDPPICLWCALICQWPTDD